VREKKHPGPSLTRRALNSTNPAWVNLTLQKIVDPVRRRQYEGDMATIRSLEGAIDCGARDYLHWLAAMVRLALGRARLARFTSIYRG
jgi:hypothetical protein